MAHGSSNLASLCKYLPCILFLVFVSSTEYYIAPSQSYLCNVDHCLTLSQFVSVFANCSKCNSTTLIIAPGEYSLESGLIVENVHSFSMFAKPFSLSSTPRIICGLNTTFEFRNVSSVTISGVDFIECSGNQLVSVARFFLTNSTFYSHPEADGISLTMAESTAYLDRVAFLSTIESVPEYTITSLQPQENCTLDSYRILAVNSVIIVTQSLFDKSVVGAGAVIYSSDISKITIFNSTFRNNRAICCYLDADNSSRCTGAILQVYDSSMDVYDSRFEYNQGDFTITSRGNTSFTHCVFSNHRFYRKNNNEVMVYMRESNLSISFSTFVNNTATPLGAFYSNTSISDSKFVGNNQCLTIRGGHTNLDHNIFLSNNGWMLIIGFDVNVINFWHNKFVNNTMYNLIKLFAEKMTIKLNEFIGNDVDGALVWAPYHPPLKAITNNIFVDNSAIYDVLINSQCKPGLSLSLGSSRCIKCPERWYLNLVGLTIAAFVAGILLVIFMLVLNLTVAIGTLNGILFYADIVASNIDAYFPLSSTPNLVTIFISWLNLDIGFDVCFFDGMTVEAKAVLHLAFPTYVILLVIVTIVISECSSKFARLVGKGDPVAVLATMILLSYAKFFNAIIGSISMLYFKPSYGSLNFDPLATRKEQAVKPVVSVIDKVLITISSVIGVLGLVYTALVFFWQWLIRYQDKTIFKWVRYQKLQHFMEPYHAPYSIRYRYWTGLLLIVRIISFSVSAINFSRDPRVDFVSTIFVVVFLILYKAIMAKRIYKNVLLDVMETAIYFNLVFFAAFTWYSLDFGGNQVAVAYISVMITFALLLAVIVYHVFKFTSFCKLSFIKKSFQWITTKHLVKDEPDETDEVPIQRAHPAPSYISYSVVEIPSQNEVYTV